MRFRWNPYSPALASLEIKLSKEPLLNDERYPQYPTSSNSPILPSHQLDRYISDSDRSRFPFCRSRPLWITAVCGLIAYITLATTINPFSAESISNVTCYFRSDRTEVCNSAVYGGANADLISEPPTHFVPVWTSDKFPGGYVKEELPVPREAKDAHNVTAVFAAFRAAVVDTHPKDENRVMVRFSGSVYDLHNTNRWHVELSKLFRGRLPYEFRASAVGPASSLDPQDTSNSILGQLYSKNAAEIKFEFPASAFNASTTSRPPDGSNHGGVVVPIKLELLYDSQLLTTFTFELRQQWLPWAKMAICMKPLYGSQIPQGLVEWREHHRQLGFSVVHWSSRTRGMGKVVDKLNYLTGGFDTFDYSPVFQDDHVDFWDEYQTFNECFVRYKQASEFIAVHDLDEYIAPNTGHPWTREWMEHYVDVAWPAADAEASHLKMPMTWIDQQGRFGKISGERLLAVDSTLSDEVVIGVQQMHLATDGIVEKHSSRYYKSLYRTAKTRSAGVHGGWPGPVTMQAPWSLIIYHARRSQGMSAHEYHQWPLSESIVSHWARLVARIGRLNLESVYDTDVSGTEQRS